MTTSRILHLRRQGYTVAKIAQLAGKEIGEVAAAIERCKHTVPSDPTPAEIEAAKREINRAKGITDDLR